MKFADAVELIKNKEVKDMLGRGDLLEITAKNGKVYMVRYNPNKDTETLLQLSRETGTALRGAGAEPDTQLGWLYVIKYFPLTTLVFLTIGAAALLGIVYWGFFVRE